MKIEFNKTKVICPKCGQKVCAELAYGNCFVVGQHNVPDGGKCIGSGSLVENESRFLQNLENVNRVRVNNPDELTDFMFAFMANIEERTLDTMIILWDGRIVEPVVNAVGRNYYPIEIKTDGFWSREALKETLFNRLVNDGMSVAVSKECEDDQCKMYLVRWHIEWTHPEQENDEVFIGNEFPEMVKSCGWTSARPGKVPYTRAGVETDQVPIFVKKQELIESGKFSESLYEFLDP